MRNKQLLAHIDRAFDENRRFNDALLARHARITEDMIGALRSSVEENRSFFAELKADIADHRAETRAQTKVLLRVIDRFPPPQPES